jgi:tetratricopeptide (TPR) repeat protein
MESPNLDETRPTSIKVDGQSIPTSGETLQESTPPIEQGAEMDITRPVDISSDDRSGGTEAGISSASSEITPTSAQPSLDVTQPSQLNDDDMYLPPDIPDAPEKAPKRRRMWILWAVLGVLLLALIAGGSVYAGYSSAIEQRTHYQSTLFANEAANQYVLAQQDIAAGNFDRARQRLEYIIKLDPNYPNVSEQLATVLTQQRITATPTVVPTPTLTPTPDYRGRDELFTQAQNLLISRDWTGAIETLLLLRKNYPEFSAVQVDDMLFVALRNRGIDKIAQLYDLEGGNYDLTLAERFGPLDAEARNWRDWAELYIRGASFWGVDWAQSVSYFSQLAAAAPNLSDVSGWTASNRYLDALLGYGDWLAARGEWCDAQAQYDTYMTLLASSQVEPTAIYAADQCAQGASATTTPGGETTPTPEQVIPIETPPPDTTPYP